jgi:F0F1-type ATP synthase assembly protein I
LLEGQAYAGDLVVRTENTTFAYMPGSPEWLIDEYEDMIEFVASVPPLLTLLENRMRELDGRISDNVLRDLGQRIREGEDPLRELEDHETEIRILESTIRRQLAVLHSPELVRTRAQRQFLNRLWEAAGLPAVERDLEQRLDRLAERQQRIATLVSAIDQRIRRQQRDAAEKAERKQQERAKRIERPVKIVGGVLGVAALAEVLSWLNDVYDVGGPAWAWGEAALLVAIAGLALVLYASNRP